MTEETQEVVQDVLETEEELLREIEDFSRWEEVQSVIDEMSECLTEE